MEKVSDFIKLFFLLLAPYHNFILICKTKYVPPSPKAGEERNLVAESTGKEEDAHPIVYVFFLLGGMNCLYGLNFFSLHNKAHIALVIDTGGEGYNLAAWADRNPGVI